MIQNGGDVRDVRAIGGRIAAPRSLAQGGSVMLYVAIGIFLVGLGVAAVVPAMQKSAREARAMKIADDLRDFAVTFQAHARKHRDWPRATQAPGQIPAGMENELGAKWSRRTPNGIRFFWAPESLQRGVRYRAAIVLSLDNRTPVADERRLFEEVDRQIDDGRLGSGSFQLGYRDQPFFVIEP